MKLETFNRECERLRETLTRRAAYQLGSIEEGEDIAQEALFYASRCQESLPEPGENGFLFAAWLNLLLKNRMLKRRERLNVRARIARFVGMEYASRKNGDMIDNPRLLQAITEEQQNAIEEGEQSAAAALLYRLMEKTTLSEKQSGVLAAILRGESVSDYARAHKVSRQAMHLHYKAALSALRATAATLPADTLEDFSGEALFALGAHVATYCPPLH